MLITTTTAKSGKINICADGEYQFTVPALLWFSSGISENSEISEEELSELYEKSAAASAFESAMRMLSLRAHSEKELKTKLGAKFTHAAAEAAVEKCRGLGLLDDEKFAFMFAEELHLRKGFAPRRILLELCNRGINADIAENAVSALDISAENSIIKVTEKMKITSRSTEKEKERAIRRLMSMGYSYGEISKALRLDDGG